MDTELLKQLINDPSRWLYYLLLAAIVLFILKIINVAAETVARHLSEKVRSRKGLIATFKGVIQATAIALVIYLANSVYWSHTVDRLIPPAGKKPIVSFVATVEMVIDSNDQGNWHFADRGGYIAFAYKDRSLLAASAGQSDGRPIATNEYLYRGVFTMDASDAAMGQSAQMLLQSEYAQVEFQNMPKDAVLLRGKAICVINNEIRVDLLCRPQKADDGKVMLRDMAPLKDALK
jgi:hypothetical protein